MRILVCDWQGGRTATSLHIGARISLDPSLATPTNFPAVTLQREIKKCS
ncbi:hypothetical protein [Desulfovulcanus sp.]